MHHIKVSPEEVTAVKALQAKLALAKSLINIAKRSCNSETLTRDTSGYFFGEYDITSLPMPVKKHIITAGIIQGDIFKYGDGFACIEEDITTESKTTFGKTLYLQIRALSPNSYQMALGVVETLIDEVLNPQKKTLKRLTGNRMWPKVLTNEFEIQSLSRPVISHIITKGIIRGEIHQFSGGVVNAKGSPYLLGDLPQYSLPEPERPIYLLIQGQDEKTLYWSVDHIKRLIKEAEQTINDDGPEVEVVFEGTVQPSEDSAGLHGPAPKEVESDAGVMGAKSVDEPQPGERCVQYPPFMPQLGQNVEADVTRCAVLVQWLLAHPLLVSFMASPPKGCESKIISKKIVTTALLCLPLYDQYECTHMESKKICFNCHKFFNEAQKTVYECFEAVANQGYDISLLMCVDNYIKKLEANPEDIGVLYDYPLPLNLFYIDSCRLFIDLVVNCGLETESSLIESYLRRTQQWYPVKAFKKIVVKTEVNPCPSKNRKTHQYPLYGSLDHHGGLINFHLGTIGSASPGRLFPADAPKIPKCSYFPFLNKLSVFSNLYNFSKNYNDRSERQTDEMVGSISLAAYQMTKEFKNANKPISLPYGSQEGRESQQHATSSTTRPTSDNPSRRSQTPVEGSQTSTFHNVFSNPQNQTTNAKPQLKKEDLPQDPWMLQGSLPPSFSTVRDPNEKLTLRANPLIIQPIIPDEHVLDSRKLRKQMRKEKLMKKKEEEQERKRKEIDQTLETLKEKHGTNSFWTVNTSELEAEDIKEKLTNLLNTPTSSSGLLSTQVQTPPVPLLADSMFSPNLQQVLSSMQMSMPALQPSLFGTQQLMPTRQGSECPLKPPLINTEQMLGSQQPVKGGAQSPKDESQQSALTDVINQLEEFIQTTGKKTGDEAEHEASQMDEDTVQKPSYSMLQGESPVSSVQQDLHSVEKTSAEGEPDEDSAYSAIIHQLQKFINSTSQTTSEKEPSSADPCEQTPKSVETETTNEKGTSSYGFERKVESPQTKHVSADQFGKTPKQVERETTNAKGTSRYGFERKEESSQLKHVSDDHFETISPQPLESEMRGYEDNQRYVYEREAGSSQLKHVSADQFVKVTQPLESEMRGDEDSRRYGYERKVGSPQSKPVSADQFEKIPRPHESEMWGYEDNQRYVYEREAGFSQLKHVSADQFVKVSQPLESEKWGGEDSRRYGYERKIGSSQSKHVSADRFEKTPKQVEIGMLDYEDSQRYGYERKAGSSQLKHLSEDHFEKAPQPLESETWGDEDSRRYDYERKVGFSQSKHVSADRFEKTPEPVESEMRDYKGYQGYGYERKAGSFQMKQVSADQFEEVPPLVESEMWRDEDSRRYGYERKLGSSQSKHLSADRFENMPRPVESETWGDEDSQRYGYERKAGSLKRVSADRFENIPEPVESEMWGDEDSRRYGYERKAGSSQSKRVSADRFENIPEPVESGMWGDEDSRRYGYERKAGSSQSKRVSADRFENIPEPVESGMWGDEDSRRYGYERKAGFSQSKRVSADRFENIPEPVESEMWGDEDSRRYGYERKAGSSQSKRVSADRFENIPEPVESGMWGDEDSRRYGYERKAGCSQSKRVSADQFEKISEPVESETWGYKDSQRYGYERKLGSSQLKRVYTESSQSSKPKRSYIEISNEASTTSPTPTTSNTTAASNPASRPTKPSSVKERLGVKPKISTDVSILGDSLLKNARKHFGGLARYDHLKDSNIMMDLKRHVISYLNKGGELRPYCFLMCGVNDVINTTDPKSYVKQLKLLLNFLTSKGHHVLLATLPPYISTNLNINKRIPVINGMILSFQTKQNITIIPFHKLYEDHENQKILFSSFHTDFESSYVVLSDPACELIRLQIEFEVPALR